MQPIRNDQLIILRHLEDVQDYTVSDRNNGLLETELEKIPNITHFISEYMINNSFKRVIIISSPQIRCITTSEKVIEKLSEYDEYDIQLKLDPRIRDLYHGKYFVPENYQPGTELPAVKEANKVFVEQSFKKRNLIYRNGDPILVKGIPTYPIINKLFTEYGENQLEFSLRFYSFLIDLGKQLKENKDTLIILITHTAIVFRLFELDSLFKKINDKKVKIGELPFYEWDEKATIMENIPSGSLFVYPGDLKTLDFNFIAKNSELLVREITYYKKL